MRVWFTKELKGYYYETVGSLRGGDVRGGFRMGVDGGFGAG